MCREIGRIAKGAPQGKPRRESLLFPSGKTSGIPARAAYVASHMSQPT